MPSWLPNSRAKPAVFASECGLDYNGRLSNCHYAPQPEHRRQAHRHGERHLSSHSAVGQRIVGAGVVDAARVTDQHVNERAHFQALMPVASRARQARDLDAEHQSTWPSPASAARHCRVNQLTSPSRRRRSTGRSCDRRGAPVSGLSCLALQRAKHRRARWPCLS